jgi:hypothetical protein
MEVLALLSGHVEVGDVSDVAKGEVPVDSGGQGSFQRCKMRVFMECCGLVCLTIFGYPVVFFSFSEELSLTPNV